MITNTTMRNNKSKIGGKWGLMSVKKMQHIGKNNIIALKEEDGTPINDLNQLLRNWAWLHQGYWCYRSLTDWLIDWLIDQEMYRILFKALEHQTAPRPTFLSSRHTTSTSTLHSPVISDNSHQEIEEGQGCWWGQHLRRLTARQWRDHRYDLHQPLQPMPFRSSRHELMDECSCSATPQGGKATKLTFIITALSAFFLSSTRQSHPSSWGERCPH